MIESPCNKICTLDAKSGLCLGCGRTGDEIGGWTGYGAAHRHEIMLALPSRLERLALHRDPSARTRVARPGGS